MYDVLIIDSGVIGVPVVRYLSVTYLGVTVMGRDVPEKHASYKIGGIPGAQNKSMEDSDLPQLTVESCAMFPQSNKPLLDEIGIDVQFKNSELIKIVSKHDDILSIERQYQFLNSQNRSVRQLSNDNLL